MDPESSLLETDEASRSRRFLAIEEASSDQLKSQDVFDDDFLEVTGRASESFKKFSKIHNSTFTFEGVSYPSMKMAV